MLGEKTGLREKTGRTPPDWYLLRKTSKWRTIKNYMEQSLIVKKYLEEKHAEHHGKQYLRDGDNNRNSEDIHEAISKDDQAFLTVEDLLVWTGMTRNSPEGNNENNHDNKQVTGLRIEESELIMVPPAGLSSLKLPYRVIAGINAYVLGMHEKRNRTALHKYLFPQLEWKDGEIGEDNELPSEEAKISSKTYFFPSYPLHAVLFHPVAEELGITETFLTLTTPSKNSKDNDGETTRVVIYFPSTRHTYKYLNQRSKYENVLRHLRAPPYLHSNEKILKENTEILNKILETHRQRNTISDEHGKKHGKKEKNRIEKTYAYNVLLDDTNPFIYIDKNTARSLNTVNSLNAYVNVKKHVSNPKNKELATEIITLNNEEQTKEQEKGLGNYWEGKEIIYSLYEIEDNLINQYDPLSYVYDLSVLTWVEHQLNTTPIAETGRKKNKKTRNKNSGVIEQENTGTIIPALQTLQQTIRNIKTIQTMEKYLSLAKNDSTEQHAKKTIHRQNEKTSKKEKLAIHSFKPVMENTEEHWVKNYFHDEEELLHKDYYKKIGRVIDNLKPVGVNRENQELLSAVEIVQSCVSLEDALTEAGKTHGNQQPTNKVLVKDIRDYRMDIGTYVGVKIHPEADPYKKKTRALTNEYGGEVAIVTIATNSLSKTHHKEITREYTSTINFIMKKISQVISIAEKHINTQELIKKTPEELVSILEEEERKLSDLHVGILSITSNKTKGFTNKHVKEGFKPQLRGEPSYLYKINSIEKEIRKILEEKETKYHVLFARGKNKAKTNNATKTLPSTETEYQEKLETLAKKVSSISGEILVALAPLIGDILGELLEDYQYYALATNNIVGTKNINDAKIKIEQCAKEIIMPKKIGERCSPWFLPPKTIVYTDNNEINNNITEILSSKVARGINKINQIIENNEDTPNDYFKLIINNTDQKQEELIRDVEKFIAERTQKLSKIKTPLLDEIMSLREENNQLVTNYYYWCKGLEGVELATCIANSVYQNRKKYSLDNHRENNWFTEEEKDVLEAVTNYYAYMEERCENQTKNNRTDKYHNAINECDKFLLYKDELKQKMSDLHSFITGDGTKRLREQIEKIITPRKPTNTNNNSFKDEKKTVEEALTNISNLMKDYADKVVSLDKALTKLGKLHAEKTLEACKTLLPYSTRKYREEIKPKIQAFSELLSQRPNKNNNTDKKEETTNSKHGKNKNHYGYEKPVNPIDKYVSYWLEVLDKQLEISSKAITLPLRTTDGRNTIATIPRKTLEKYYLGEKTPLEHLKHTNKTLLLHLSMLGNTLNSNTNKDRKNIEQLKTISTDINKGTGSVIDTILVGVYPFINNNEITIKHREEIAQAMKGSYKYFLSDPLVEYGKHHITQYLYGNNSEKKGQKEEKHEIMYWMGEPINTNGFSSLEIMSMFPELSSLHQEFGKTTFTDDYAGIVNKFVELYTEPTEIQNESNDNYGSSKTTDTTTKKASKLEKILSSIDELSKKITTPLPLKTALNHPYGSEETAYKTIIDAIATFVFVGNNGVEEIVYGSTGNTKGKKRVKKKSRDKETRIDPSDVELKNAVVRIMGDINALPRIVEKKYAKIIAP